MKYLLRLSLINILRQKRRTVLTVSVIALGMAMFISFSGLIRGVQDKQKENLIGFETSHLKIRSGSFDETKPYSTSNFITNYREIENILKTKKYIMSCTERISFTADLDNGVDAVPVVAVGVNLQKDPSVFSLTNFFIAGGLKTGGIVLGKSLADDMKIGIGDQAYITFHNGQGVIDSIGFQVTGIVQAVDPQVNNSTVYIDINDAKKALNIDSVMEIAVITPDIHKTDQYGKELQKTFPEEKVYTWYKLGEYYLKFAQADATSAYFFIFFMAIIAVVGIINTMLLSVYEKKKEIGMLKALGMTDPAIEFLFVLEGFWIGFWGCLIGLIIGCAVNLYFANVGFNLTIATANTKGNLGYDLMGIVKAEWDLPVMMSGFIAGILISSIASLYPARKTVKLQPAESLRNI